jgi:hypothetical protein
MRNSHSKIALLCAAAFVLAVPAYAAKTDMQTLNVQSSKPQVTLSKADLAELENVGLYSSASEGSLGKGLWKDAKRSDLLKLLDEMPVQSQEPTVQRLIFGALLSQTDSSLINNDVPLEPGHDLFTLRLEKLIQAGAYRQAQDLYSSIDELEPYHERLARAGILAMLLNSEKSLACVEAETVRETFAESKFVQEILAFCDVTMSDTPSPDSMPTLANLNLRNIDLITTDGAAMAYSKDNFDSLPLIEKALLTAERKISFKSSGDTDFNSIPPTHLRILMSADDLSAEDRFRLTAAAESWGLAMPGELVSLYKAALPPAGGDPSTLQVPAGAADWEKLALYHVIAANSEEEGAQWDAIKKGLASGNRYGIAALKPYADVIAETQPADATVGEITTAIKVLAASGTAIPPHWRERVEQIPLSDEKSVVDQQVYALHTAVDLAQKRGKKDPEDAETAGAFPYPSGSRGGYLLKNIIENVDNPVPNSDNAGRIYEKDYGLTFKQDYVMPSTAVWNHLLEASQRGNTAETVLLSASVLQGADLGKIYPGLLDDVLAGLNNVGLTDISQDLAIAAVLGSTQTN